MTNEATKKEFVEYQLAEDLLHVYGPERWSYIPERPAPGGGTYSEEVKFRGMKMPDGRSVTLTLSAQANESWAKFMKSVENSEFSEVKVRVLAGATVKSCEQYDVIALELGGWVFKSRAVTVKLEADSWDEV